MEASGEPGFNFDLEGEGETSTTPSNCERITFDAVAGESYTVVVRAVTGTVELVRKGVLLKYVVASLFRVATGYLLAVFIGILLEYAFQT